MGTTWHQNFNPQQFLARIDVEKLIRAGEIPELLEPLVKLLFRDGAQAQAPAEIESVILVISNGRRFY